MYDDTDDDDDDGDDEDDYATDVSAHAVRTHEHARTYTHRDSPYYTHIQKKTIPCVAIEVRLLWRLDVVSVLDSRYLW